MVLAGAIVLLLASNGVERPAARPSLEPAVLGEINRVRATPLTYAPVLSAYRRAFQGEIVYEADTEEGIETQEGPQAVDEALRDLKRRGAAPILVWDEALAASAADLADDQRRSGGVGHTTSAGEPFPRRLARHAPVAATAGEIIAYGETTQEAVVRAFLVDDGVPDRGHRQNLFEGRYRKAGVACRPHPQFGVTCVVDLSS